MDMRQTPISEAPQEPNWRGMVRAVRPTLIVAIGGTGTAAAKVARSRLEGFVGSQHHYIAFRAFDTALQDGREPQMVDNSEYVYLGGFNAQSVMSDVMSGKGFPHWAKWLPPRLSFQQVAFGAGGIRPIGRLCYFYHRNRVEGAIKEALTTITDSDLALRFQRESRIQVNLEAGIDIHLIGSVCGGTGSGIFLDLAFDLRRWAERHTNREVTVTGHLVLPEAFRGKAVVMRALEANAYIALQELDRYMNATSDDPWTVEYVQDRTEISQRAPFDHCYLLNGLQQGGTSDIETLTSAIGEAITLLTLSQVGKKISEGVINLAGQVKSTRDQQGRACCYSSYGVLGIEFPKELLGEVLGRELADKLRNQLLSKPKEHTEETANAEAASFKEQMQLGDFRAINDLVPDPNPDVTPVDHLKDHKATHDSAKSVLQNLLAVAHDDQRRERTKLKGQPFFDRGKLREYFKDREDASLQEIGGINLILRHLSYCSDALNDFKAQLNKKANEFQDIASRHEATGNALERGNITGKDIHKLLAEDLESWKEFVQNETLATVYADQARLIGDLISSISKDHVKPWERIQGLLSNLRPDDPRNETAYYRAHRSRISAAPLAWFKDILIAPNQPLLLADVRSSLFGDLKNWINLSLREATQRFYQLCVAAIQRHSESENNCDQILARCFDYPSHQYRTEISAFLARALANWEIQESYSLRDNKREISAIGVQIDSRLYGVIRESYGQISSVDEQRPDYIPILRTEHGISLSGLKSLSSYSKSLLASVVEEQRYDLHFFNDRRWVTRFEFAGEDSVELEKLYTFSAATMLGLVERSDGKGYILRSSQEPFGRYRREAYLAFCRNNFELKKIVKQQEDLPEWKDSLRLHVVTLEKNLESAFGPERNELFLSLDVYQLHAEIRALLRELQVEEMGL